MHRPWSFLGAWFGLLTPALALAQPAPEAAAGNSPGKAASDAATTPDEAPPGQVSPEQAEEANENGEAEAADAEGADTEAESTNESAPPPESPAAQEALPPPLPDDEEPELPMTPPALDTLGGHFVVSAGGGFVNPSGRYASSTPDHAGWGWLFGGDVGFGVSRSVVLGGWGHYQSLPGTSSCSDCTATSWALGPFVRFHLVQGLRFDPWMGFSVGYRKSMLQSPSDSLDFSGFDWARLRVGGDWYALKNLGFGPFLEFVSGGFFSRPQGTGNLRTHWHFALGLRLVLDVPGKP